MAPPDQVRWMEGLPPPPEAGIRFDDGSFYSWPQIRWTFSNIQQLVPTRSVWRGPDACRPLAGSTDGLGRPAIRTTDGQDLTWDMALDELHTDGRVVLHRGRLVHEEYRAHGQVLAIDRPSGVVVAHMGSAPRPPSTLLDGVMQPLLDAIIGAVQ